LDLVVSVGRCVDDRGDLHAGVCTVLVWARGIGGGGGRLFGVWDRVAVFGVCDNVSGIDGDVANDIFTLSTAQRTRDENGI